MRLTDRDHEILKCAIHVYVITKQNPSGPDFRPDRSEFHGHVSVTVQTVMQEHVNAGQLGNKLRQQAASSPAQQMPSRTKRCRNQKSDLIVRAFAQRREINAPETALVVHCKSLKQERSCHSVPHTGLNDNFQLPQAADRVGQPGQSQVRVVECAKCGPEKLRLDPGHSVFDFAKGGLLQEAAKISFKASIKLPHQDVWFHRRGSPGSAQPVHLKLDHGQQSVPKFSRVPEQQSE